MSSTKRPGRPVGWRKDITRPHLVCVRLTEDDYGWLRMRADERACTESEMLRELIDQARNREVDI